MTHKKNVCYTANSVKPPASTALSNPSLPAGISSIEPPQPVSPRTRELQPPQQFHLSQGRAEPGSAGTETLSTPLTTAEHASAALWRLLAPFAQAAAPSNYTQELDSKPALPLASPQQLLQGCLAAITVLSWDPGPLARICLQILQLPDQVHPARCSPSFPQPSFPRAAPDILMLLKSNPRRSSYRISSEPGNCGSECCARGHLGYPWSLAREEGSPSHSPQISFSMSFNSSLFLMTSISTTKCSHRKQLKLKWSMRFWQAHGLCLVCHQIIELKVQHMPVQRYTHDCPKCAGWGERKRLRKGERKKLLLPHCPKWPVLFSLMTATASFPQTRPGLKSPS